MRGLTNSAGHTAANRGRWGAGRARALLVAAAMSMATMLAPAPASAEIGPELVRFGSFGSGAGELSFEAASAHGFAVHGGGIAADPNTGHIFVADLGNNRISEFTAWGEFVKAWGYGVADGSTATLQTCTSTCSAGIPGPEAGQLETPNGLALDASGNLYVFERENKRVQVFGPSGAFLRTFGGEVNKTTGADICTKTDLEAGDTCGEGLIGTGPSEFSIEPDARAGADYLDIAIDGTVYVGDRNRIQKFQPDGTYIDSLPLPEPDNPAALAIHPTSGDVYIAFSEDFKPANAYLLDEVSGAVIRQLGTTRPWAIAPHPSGSIYVSDHSPQFASDPSKVPQIFERSSTDEVTDSCCLSVANHPFLATNVVTPTGGVDLYIAYSRFERNIAFIEVRGVPPEKWPAPPADPTIDAQYATTVRSESAVVKAEINPNFWADTRYRLQFGTSPCSAGGCEEIIAPPGKPLGAGVVKRSVPTEGVSLTGLKAGTTYHYRFVAESGGGGPVFGPDRTFTTYANPTTVSSACPNQALRTGASAALADCRAYEMVSPVDKAGGEVIALGNVNGSAAGLRQATPEADKLTYTSYRSYADAEGAPYSVQYIASRGADGWSTDNISPPRDAGELTAARGLDSWYKGFLEDLSLGWLVTSSDPPLAEGALTGYPNLYRRTSATDTYEALTTPTPASTGPSDYDIEVQGFTADGSRTVFRANAKLTKPAAPGTAYQVYANVEGSLRLVSELPGGTAATGGATVGAFGSNITNGREANVETAVSADGTRIYWSSGKLYLHEEGSPTIPVSAGAATFWVATPDGAKAIYSEGGALKLFERSSTSSSTLVASGVTGVAGASEDLSRIYLTSTADLAAGAKAGEPNLYLLEEGQPLRLIGTLHGGEATPTPDAFSPGAISPRKHGARVSADGSIAVFMSRAPLTGADNTDVASGEPVSQVFRYDAEADQLLCVSCNPTGARPIGYEPVFDNAKRDYWIAASFPGGEFQHHFPRIVSADGDRVFFQSSDRLSVSDTNGKIDVYAWEAPGRGECTGPASPGHNPLAGGCVTLISDGQGASDSELVDASADGDSVFLATGVSLLPQDPGQVDLYVARAGGGYPPPPAPPAPCEGEACQPAATPPPASPFSSQTFVGPGNKPKKARKRAKRCKKRSAKKKKRCVKTQRHAQYKHRQIHGGRK
jgi:sugar lactone lactonase YvrE